MIYLVDMYINTNKKYLILGKTINFLEQAKSIVDSKLDIGVIEDVKSYIDAITLFIITFKDGGFMKFVFYTGSSCLVECDYDKVLVDTLIYTSEYVIIRSRCLLADIVCIDNKMLEGINPEYKNYSKDDIVEVFNRQYDSAMFIDYGKCPVCDTNVYEYDLRCPKCSVKLNWNFNKAIILSRCKHYGAYNKELGTNKMHCDENMYNVYYDLVDTFGLIELSKMDDEMLINLLKFGKKITQNLC